MTAPSPQLRQVVYGRADWRCERCGVSLWGRPSFGYSVHHRRPGQMGGRRDDGHNVPANLLLLCGSGTTGCHGWVEANREAAYEVGLLVHSWQDPAEVEVYIWPGQWVLLGESYLAVMR